MQISKQDILKSLKTIATFDPKGAPYLGIQLVEGYKPLFLRSNNEGIIQSKEYGVYPTTYVSLDHLTSVLKVCPEENVELSVDERGTMHLYGTSGMGSNSESNVHTVAENHAGIKAHDIGQDIITLDIQTFLNLNIDKFVLSTTPILSNGKLMLATNKGAIITWNSNLLKDQLLKISPREAFLRMVCGQVVDKLVLTENGYWGAIIGNLTFYIKGHISGRPLFDSYDISGVEVGSLPAERLLTCLRAAVSLLDETDRIDIDPKLGVVAKGKFGDSRNSLGKIGDWARFGLQAKTAKVIIDALSQASEDCVKLESMSFESGSTMRLVCGSFSVAFRPF